MNKTQCDFDIIYNRKNTSSLKWDCIEKIYKEKDILPMWIADMDFLAPQSVIEAIKKRNEHGIFGYVESLPESYCDAIIDWVYNRHQWKIHKEWLNYTPGVVSAISSAVLAFTKPGDKIIIQTPVYPPFHYVIRENDRQILKNPLILDGERYHIDFDDLQRQIESGAKMLILCSPHNPIGRVWTREELTKVGELCTKNNVIIVSDEIHADIVYHKHKHIPIASISNDIEQNSITCIAASKTFGIAGLVTSTSIIPNASLRNKFKCKTQSMGIDTGSVFGIVASEAAYRHGETWLEQLLEYLSENFMLLDNYSILSILNLRITCCNNKFSYH